MRRAPRALLFGLVAAALVAVPACRTDPGEATALHRGDRAFARGDHEEALAEYLLSLREAPRAEGRVRAAHVYAILGRLEEARALYEEAVREDVVHAGQAVSDLVALAKAAHGNGDSYGSAYAMEAALAFQPGLVVEELALPLARHYGAIGEDARALALLMRVLGSNREDVELVLETARAHEKIEDCGRALLFYERFRELAPRRRADVQWNEGWCSLQLALERKEEGELDEALRYLDAVADLGEPKTRLAEAYFEQGEILAEMGLCADAVYAYRRVASVEPPGPARLARQARTRVDEIRFGDGGAGPC